MFPLFPVLLVHPATIIQKVSVLYRVFWFFFNPLPRIIVVPPYPWRTSSRAPSGCLKLQILHKHATIVDLIAKMDTRSLRSDIVYSVGTLDGGVIQDSVGQCEISLHYSIEHTT
jgi:hypothetical protein